MNSAYIVGVALGILAIALFVWRSRVTRGHKGRGWLTSAAVFVWFIWIAYCGFLIGYNAGNQGFSVLSLLHISR
ncbi:hypothetical protein Alches_00860 [Alicyclobacillus hesperidum subsp. aegles]|nr:hypothetical protein SD51_03435 [Alicyclobacillus tengchongensis]GLG00047.1 hypothetical protein Alches_00860 [Alicyclobacillus hesperidum subsp. aegles]